MTTETETRFACDAMLGSLARWLLAAGGLQEFLPTASSQRASRQLTTLQTVATAARFACVMHRRWILTFECWFPSSRPPAASS